MSSRYRIPLCPTEPKHGRVVDLPSGDFYCPHAEHDGRPKSHPDGPTERTRARFTYREVLGE